MIRWLPPVLAILAALPVQAQQRIEIVENLLVSRFDPASGKLLRIYDNYYTLSHPDSIARDIRPLEGIGELLQTHNAHLLKGVTRLRMREGGLALEPAIREAARIRLRPILMTTLCTLFGLLPLALGIGAGSELQRPLALAVIGGLALSTPVTLFVVPVLLVAIRGAGYRLPMSSR